MESRRKTTSPGRIVIDLLLLVVAVVLFARVAWAAKLHADVRADLAIATTEAHALYEALDRYYERNRAFPDCCDSGGFDEATLDPLRRRGYYRGYLATLLLGDRIDAYDAPDDRGADQEFWLEMTLERDPTIRLLVARSDDAPSSGGQWRDGVFVLRNGELSGRG